jgi:hypothetical protein
MINFHENNIITHGGQTTVEGFGKEIKEKFAEISAVKGLVVYAGYHGADNDGNWIRNFDAPELARTREIAEAFPNAQLILVSEPGLSDEAIRAAVEKGNAFFTWCDSENKVSAVMGW